MLAPFVVARLVLAPAPTLAALTLYVVVPGLVLLGVAMLAVLARHELAGDDEDQADDERDEADAWPDPVTPCWWTLDDLRRGTT